MREFDPDDPELMDRPQPVTEELRRDLRNLIGLNRWFGSHRLLRRWLKPWWKNRGQLKILDLCTGGGDIPRLLVAEAAKDGVAVTVEAVDYQASTVAIAREWSVDFPRIAFEAADILQRELPPEPTHDLVLCSLALHHFSEEGAVQVLRFMQASARQACLVADLERGWWTSLGIWAHVGPKSVQRGGVPSACGARGLEGLPI